MSNRVFGPEGSIDPPRNFQISLDERIRALSIGVPAYSARKRRIEDWEERLVGELVNLRSTLLSKGVDQADVARTVLEKAKTTDLSKLNALIDKHNRYFAIEANLPIDPITGGYLASGRPWNPEPPWTAERLVRCAEVAASK